jgi:hypothetical protein
MPERGDENRAEATKIANTKPRDLTQVSRTVLRSEQAKRWTKRYRTEVSASSSSLLSTFVAVSSPIRHSLAMLCAATDTLQYPLDSVKTRLQAYVTPPTPAKPVLIASDTNSIPLPTAYAIPTEPRAFMASGEVCLTLFLRLWSKC